MRLALAAGAGLLSLAVVSPAVQASTPEPLTLYRTRGGDTLEGLSVHYLTGRQDVAVVARLNAIADPDRLPIGTVLRIPTRLLKSTPVTLTVVAVTGQVLRATADGRRLPLSKGDLVSEGDRVATGDNAFATLAKDNGSRVTLPSHTTLRAAALRRTLLEGAERVDLVVESGRGQMTITPLQRTSDRFEVRTPASVAAVRGTEFRVAYDPARTISTLEVLRGKVGESATDVSPAAEIDAGQSAQRPLGGDRRIAPLPPAPSLAPADPLATFPDLTLRVADPVSGVSYHFVLARDPAFSDVFAEVTATNGVANFQSVPLAPFSARISAIDAQGVEGFAKIYLVERLPTPPAAGG